MGVQLLEHSRFELGALGRFASRRDHRSAAHEQTYRFRVQEMDAGIAGCLTEQPLAGDDRLIDELVHWGTAMDEMRR